MQLKAKNDTKSKSVVGSDKGIEILQHKQGQPRTCFFNNLSSFWITTYLLSLPVKPNGTIFYIKSTKWAISNTFNHYIATGFCLTISGR